MASTNVFCIQKCDMFHTPKNPKELNDWVTGLNGSERIAAMTAMYMLQNLICSSDAVHIIREE